MRIKFLNFAVYKNAQPVFMRGHNKYSNEKNIPYHNYCSLSSNNSREDAAGRRGHQRQSLRLRDRWHEPPDRQRFHERGRVHGEGVERVFLRHVRTANPTQHLTYRNTGRSVFKRWALRDRRFQYSQVGRHSVCAKVEYLRLFQRRLQFIRKRFFGREYVQLLPSDTWHSRHELQRSIFRRHELELAVGISRQPLWDVHEGAFHRREHVFRWQLHDVRRNVGKYSHREVGRIELLRSVRQQ